MPQFDSRFERIEHALREVYNYCPPTFTRYSVEGRAVYAAQWEWLMGQLGLSSSDFHGKNLLDVGCGSCEKACFYHDWGAQVTGIEMTASVIERAHQVIGSRPIKIVPGSLFNVELEQQFDIVIADGVLHHTADTFTAVQKCVDYVRPGGLLIVGLVNYWGKFWWFGAARGITRLLGGSDFHRRALWGRRLFEWTRQAQEGTAESSAYYRGVESWSYDWFATPRWSRHSPKEILSWLNTLSLEHFGSAPSIVQKVSPRSAGARLVRKVAGGGEKWMGLYWLLNGELNMLYVCARKPVSPAAVSALP